MRSLSGSIATCLIFVPLIAVPVLAVLGMPQLSPSASGAPADDLKFAQEEPGPGASSDLLAPVRVSDSKTDSEGAARSNGKEPDPFAEFVRGSDDAHQRATAARSPASSPKRPQRWPDEGNGLPQRALFSSEPVSDERPTANHPDRSAASGPFDDHLSGTRESDQSAKAPAVRRALPEAEAIVANDIQPATVPPSANADEPRASQSHSAIAHGSAWKRAVGRLNALGIRDYQLQPGEREGEFNFSCRLPAPRNPRVIHRFEAEAADPLDAVNQVLRQIDDWRARQAERRQASHDSVGEQGVTSRASDTTEVEVTNRNF
jgi:hypothetical protein